MQFRLWRASSGIAAEEQETDLPPGDGYHVDVMAGHDTDIDRLLTALHEQAALQIGRLHLRPSVGQPGWALAGDEVAGRLVHDGAEAPYGVVVDGRRMSWDELGRALEPFEGWQFRLLIGAIDDQTGADADVVSLPTADRDLLEIFGDLEDFADDSELMLDQWEHEQREGVRLLRRARPKRSERHPHNPRSTMRPARSVREYGAVACRTATSRGRPAGSAGRPRTTGSAARRRREP